MTDDALAAAIQAELARIGLDSSRAPFDMVTAEVGNVREAARAEDAFLLHLKSLRPGAAWRDVFVDLPTHWDIDDPQTWTIPFRPLGPLDYQAPPVGPAFLLGWPESTDERCLERFRARAELAAFPVHAAWFVPIDHPAPQWTAYVVLAHHTSDAALTEFRRFVDADADSTLRGILRTGAERYDPIVRSADT